ncbi:MAG: hypothetical protein M1608_09360 [Candidatus Omnitrophica bacterium]|nr:hypothetical protein [Candidatus Omnitrophota bacterium]
MLFTPQTLNSTLGTSLVVGNTYHSYWADDEFLANITVDEAGNCFFTGNFLGDLTLGSTNLTKNFGLGVWADRLQ